MVDWGMGGRKLHVERMHAAARYSRLLSISDMSQEDEAELNVMDFVETEFKSDACESEQMKQSLKRKKTRPGPKNTKGNNKGSGVKKPKCESVPPGEGKAVYKKRKRKYGHRSVKGKTTNFALYYPCATFLKALCDKVGSTQGSSEALPNRIFDQLRRTDVHYPYASLLEALHQHAGVSARSARSPSKEDESQDQDSGLWEVGKVMRNLHYPVRRTGDGGGNVSEDVAAPFSTMLMAVVMQHKIQDYKSTHTTGEASACGNVHGIGQILKDQMPQSWQDDPPPSEFYSSSLLQKISFSAEQDLQVQGDRLAFPGGAGRVRVPEWSTTTESSQSEEDDLDWRPTHWLAKKVSKDTAAPTKRKSVRKKSIHIDNPPQVDQPNTSQEDLSYAIQRPLQIKKVIKIEPQKCTASESARAKLQQFIMSRRKDSCDKRIKKAHKSRKKGKRKQINNTEENDLQWETIWLPDSSHNESCSMEEDHAIDALEDMECDHLGSGEPQSLLKEYLLKPAGEEIVINENCDIPKVETNFLFSRLLQNFKNLAESNQSDKVSERISENCKGPSILRGMLAAGNSSTELPEKQIKAEETEEVCLSEHQSASSSSVRQFPTQSSLLSDSTKSQIRVKEENIKVEEEHIIKVEEEDIRVECNEEILYKIECEEDGFECQVCHLQFSSGIDLSNHQLLFHCSEDPQTPGSHRLLGCSVDGLQGGVLQEKQPA